MRYIRNIFTQDLRDGKQIAFPKEPSNIFFGFDYSNQDDPRRIIFRFIEKNTASVFFQYNSTVISTRLYAAASEARIDGELKRFLIDKLSAQVSDIIVFRRVNLNLYEFEFFSSTSPSYEYGVYRDILNGGNHEIAIVQNDSEDTQSTSDLEPPSNTIYYGAPGTGKSHKVDQIIGSLNPKYYERVTFHPEFDNSSFVGGYKPISGKNEEGEDVIKYKFVPQAFTNIYERAWKDLEHPYYLVIEEINRGNCAEIFGEIFQLLDRTSNYTVSPSKELKEYLEKDAFQDAEHSGIVNGLKLPPNLRILATMNTSDQSLFPMDSAFKRRWDWEYIPICYDETDDFGANNNSFKYEIDIEDGNRYSWIQFIKQINRDHIKENESLGADKCIGNYFIKPDNGNTISLKPFINKVIFYLWNDVFKDENNTVFEPKSSYEDFFPIEINGKRKIKELFARINFTSITNDTTSEDNLPLRQVAEDQAEYGKSEE